MIPAIWAILRSGLFMHSAYAARYLGTRRKLWQSLLHYLVVGERRGYRPNPFYDPVFARKAGVPSLARYLRDEPLRNLPPSPMFDPVYYRAAAMGGKAGHPLVHFWRRGFDAGLDPSPTFDIGFFKKAVQFFRPDKKEYAFELFADRDHIVPDAEADLVMRAEAFQARVELTIARRLSGGPRRFLVVVQADRSYRPAFAEPTRSFDVLLNDYGGEGLGTDADYDARADYVTVQRGTKTTAIRKLLAEAPDILLAYEYVLFLDDDVGIDGNAIDRLFAIVAAHGLDLAQASLTEHSHCVFANVKQPMAGPGLTPLTSVEIMMPVVSNRVLREFEWVFAEAVSGWAVDFLLSAEVRKRFGNRIALVGDVVATHDRPIDMEGGAFYRFLRANGIDARVEAGRIATRFGIEVSEKSIQRHCEPLDEQTPDLRSLAADAERRQSQLQRP